jgi:hypothetical protein
MTLGLARASGPQLKRKSLISPREQPSLVEDSKIQFADVNLRSKIPAGRKFYEQRRRSEQRNDHLQLVYYSTLYD